VVIMTFSFVRVTAAMVVTGRMALMDRQLDLRAARVVTVALEGCPT